MVLILELECLFWVCTSIKIIFIIISISFEGSVGIWPIKRFIKWYFSSFIAFILFFTAYLHVSLLPRFFSYSSYSFRKGFRQLSYTYEADDDDATHSEKESHKGDDAKIFGVQSAAAAAAAATTLSRNELCCRRCCCSAYYVVACAVVRSLWRAVVPPFFLAMWRCRRCCCCRCRCRAVDVVVVSLAQKPCRACYVIR